MRRKTTMAFLKHYGTKRESGRYPWGSGELPYQHEPWFRGKVLELRSQGWSETDIAASFGMNTRELRDRMTLAKESEVAAQTSQIYRMREAGHSYRAIGERLGIPEATVRARLKPANQEKAKITSNVSNVLKDAVDSNKYIDIGAGVENHLGVSQDKLRKAVSSLTESGDYKVQYLQVKQMGTGKMTSLKVLTSADTPWKEVNANKQEIRMPVERSEDGGRTFDKIRKPVDISSSRVKIKYAEDGGIEKDGVIELRRGVEDLNLGQARYAQVRISVDGTHYLKGMAMYSDNMPDGYDIVFNTNKKRGTPMIEGDKGVLKPQKDDPSNPFGATIKKDEDLIRCQSYYIDKDGKRKQSALNIVSEEGNWGEWDNTIASQMLSKQYPSTAKRQLKIYADKKIAEFDSINELTNPTIKKKLMESFADGCDAAASHLKAAGFPRQKWKVILPFPELKDNEIFAPDFRDGEEVICIRYPHGGVFEIPRLIVNNKTEIPNKLIPNAKDAVGINAKVAEQLSGADFDGDTVLVIPTAGQTLKTEKVRKSLQEFDPKASYPSYPGMKVMDERTKGIQMGMASNLITDMTIKGAPMDEIERAVKHSMVVIDAKKHKLNWQQSEQDFGISELKKKYQSTAQGGASTLISKATSQAHPYARKEVTSPKTMNAKELADWNAGKKVYRETGETYKTVSTNRKGETVIKEHRRTIESTKMAEVDDARKLSSGSMMEEIYAEHANRMKQLANDARKVARETPTLKYSPSAKKTYAPEVEALDAALRKAQANAPLERRAQIIANYEVSSKIAANPSLKDDKDKLKKIKGQAITSARDRVGAKKEIIIPTEKQWEAIQAGAITDSKLKAILDNSDLDRIKQLATPKTNNRISDSTVSRIKGMLASGHTTAEIAEALGVSTSTVSNFV